MHLQNLLTFGLSLIALANAAAVPTADLKEGYKHGRNAVFINGVYNGTKVPHHDIAAPPSDTAGPPGCGSFPHTYETTQNVQYAYFYTAGAPVSDGIDCSHSSGCSITVTKAKQVGWSITATTGISFPVLEASVSASISTTWSESTTNTVGYQLGVIKNCCDYAAQFALLTHVVGQYRKYTYVCGGILPGSDTGLVPFNAWVPNEDSNGSTCGVYELCGCGKTCVYKSGIPQNRQCS